MIKVSTRHITLIILLLFFAVRISFAQRYTTRLINSSQGLSNNEMNDIFQDSRGYLWFATEDGLNRYDGYEFVVFRKDIHDTLSIGSNQVHCIVEDDSNNLWVGTDKGISLLNVSTGVFRNISFADTKIGVLTNETFDLVFDQQGSLWCLMSDRLIQYWPERNNFSEFLLPSKYHIDRDQLLGSLTYHQKTGTIYIGTGAGLVYLKENYREVRETAIQDVKVHDVFICKHDKIWVATSNGILKCEKYEDNFFKSDCDYVLKGIEVKEIIHDYDDNLILLTEDNIMLIDELTYEVIAESFLSIPAYDVLPLIRSSMIDNMMNLWIGTQKGICHADLKPLNFDYYNTDSQRDVFIHNNLISSICDDDWNIYLGSLGGGLEVIDKYSLESKYYSFENPNLYFPERSVNRVFKDSDNRIWVLGKRIYRFYPEKGSFVPVDRELGFPELSNIRDSRIYDIIEIEKDVFFVSHTKGIYYFNKNSGEFRNDSILRCDTLDLPLFGMENIEDSEEYFWFSAHSGIISLNKVTKEYNYYPTDALNGLSGRVITIDVDKSGRLWAGTPQGLFRLNEDDSTFAAFTVQDGFSNDFINSIEEDKNGWLWMGTNKGLINFNPETKEVRNFGVQHGLPAMEFNPGASYYGSDEVMYFGSIEGLSFFDPEKKVFVERIPSLRITAVRFFNRDKQTYNVIPGSEIQLSDKESVQIYFSAMDYSMARYNKYKYRLSSSGIDEVWNTIGTENSILLSGLDHGKYVFEVIGANSEGAWNMSPATISILVKAPFLRRKGFLVLISILIVLLAFLFFIHRTKTLRRSNRVLRDKENVAKEVMQQKNLLSRRNKNIEDSLKYAQRIQYAMFTSASEIRKMIPESFVLQKPKDIVSGDFYWAKKVGAKVFLAAADCTGHGVPGAFMSLIGIEFFRQIVGVQKIYKPSLILDEINRNFDLIFGKDADIDLRDGMDLAFIVIDLETNIVQFSGAVNPLYIIRAGEIIEIKGDRIVLGPDLGFGKESFNNHEIQLEEGDMLYIFSDGYVDQFGGPEGKKFKFRRFRHLLMSIADQPVEVQQSVLENSMRDWMGNHEQVDDILVMGLRPFFTSKNVKNPISSTSQEVGLSSARGHRPEKVY